MTQKTIRRPLVIELVGYGPYDGLWIRPGSENPPAAWVVLRPDHRSSVDPEFLRFVPTGRVNAGCLVYELERK